MTIIEAVAASSKFDAFFEHCHLNTPSRDALRSPCTLSVHIGSFKKNDGILKSLKKIILKRTEIILLLDLVNECMF